MTRPPPPFARPRWFVLATAGGLLALGAGCATTTYEAHPLSAATSADAFAARSLAAPDLRRFLTVHLGHDFNSTEPPVWDFAALTWVAIYDNPTLEVARARWAAAQAAVGSAGTRPDPTLGFFPTFDANPASGVSPWTLGFTLDWPLETAGRRGYRVAEAQHAANSARLALAGAVWRVRSRVRQSLTELAGAIALQEILSRQQSVQNEIVGLLEARWKAGESSLSDVQLVRRAAGQTALDLDAAKQASAQARLRLADALGLPGAAVVDLRLSLSELDPLPPPEEAAAPRRAALLHRTDVLGALAAYEASQAALQLEIAQQYPDLHLGPGYAWDQGENKFTLGLSLTLPLFNRHRGPIAEAEARRREAAATFRAVQAHAIGEVERAFAGYRDALHRQAIAHALFAAEQQRQQATDAALAAGAIDRVDGLRMQAELGLAGQRRAAAFNAAQLALGALEDAMQRPLSARPDATVPATWLHRIDISP